MLPSDKLVVLSIKHEKELDGKSTAAHARVIAPNDVNIYGWQEIPEYENPDQVLLLFPGPVSFFARRYQLPWLKIDI